MVGHHHAPLSPYPKRESLGQSMADFAKGGPRAWLVIAVICVCIFGLIHTSFPSRKS